MSRRLPIFTLLAFFVLLPGLRAAAQQNWRGGGPPARSAGAFAPGDRGQGGAPHGDYGSHGRGPPAAVPSGRGYGGGYAPAPFGVVPGYGAPPPYAAPPIYAPPRRSNSLGADWRPQQEEARSGVRQGQFAPLSRVIEGLQRRTPGRQLDTGIEYDSGRPVYRVRWLTSHGRRVDFLVDAATGNILGER